ncbi:secreted RxLR effector peptide protein, putative [Phytophthora infestans T30-4]|uniref:Secreted RxLR effector peptide protein, putative n=1 Tax=Phytophthora infestans (strain T30-4) TaxID=403677 RepID=D0P3U3_PHYIT|nr:secreted RxLR effector peptide protein, putative [Phytophthora infestans T30-4]EEY62038.1 secreted RxLR effector peptide protein, putative [Phytophthora infestans T30-4]|eukprot:XP_002895031.1 secreted RxLR effector peptide protein, putative [Phytophthora infestans T30-4]
MRVGFVFALLVVSVIVCLNGLTSAESTVVMNNRNPDSINVPISDDITSRNLRASGEERAYAFVDKIKSLFSRPGISQKVESLQKNPAMVKNLEKAALSLRHFKRRFDERRDVCEVLVTWFRRRSKEG